ncbi:hypothetical protein ACFLQW_03830 [Candidatus Zixiibacteriota bacterium]
MRIVKFSDAYFELLKLCAECNEFFSVGEQVVVLYRGVVIIIGEEGESEFREEWTRMFR